MYLKLLCIPELVQKHFSAQMQQIRLAEELTALPRPSSCIKGSLLLREESGWREKEGDEMPPFMDPRRPCILLLLLLKHVPYAFENDLNLDLGFFFAHL